MLSSSDIRQFHHDGYLVFRGLASPQTCAAMRQLVSEQLAHPEAPLEYEADVGYPGAPASLDAPGGKTIRRLRGAYQRHALFAQWAANPEIVGPLSQLFDEDVFLTLAHHNCIMTKHPNFGTATGWHRDIRYWSFAAPDLISVWLALGDETGDNGALRVIPGSHRAPIAPHQLDELDFLRPDVADNAPLFRQGITVELRQGDVIFFHSRLFHAAGRNLSDSIKMSLVYAYHGAGNHALPGSKSATAGNVALGSPVLPGAPQEKR